MILVCTWHRKRKYDQEGRAVERVGGERVAGDQDTSSNKLFGTRESEKNRMVRGRGSRP